MKNLQELQAVIHRLDRGELTVPLAAKICGYSDTHIRNVFKKYKVYGDAVFIHGNKGRTPAIKTSYAVRRQVINLYKKEGNGINFSAFADILEEFYGVKLSSRTVYNILTSEGFKSPESRKKPTAKDIHRPRARRQCEGELLQIDGTPYDWFGDGHTYTIHGSIDDATGKFTGLYMCENECLYGYLELIRQTFYTTGGGHPAAVYSDRASIFCYTPRDSRDLTVAEQLTGIHEKRTQWQRVLDEVHVEQILAWSPQAKGRVERAWRTVQGTLPWRFQHLGIKDIDTANAYLLNVFLPWFNRKYGVKPASDIKVYHKAYLDPDYVLCARYSRRTNSAGVFSFEGYKWLLEKKKAGNVDFDLCVSERGIKAYYNGEFYPVRLLEDIQEVEGENTPHVLKAIIYKYMYKDGHVKR